MVSEDTELNICIKFYEMTGKTATDTVQIAFAVAAMSRTRCFKWFNLFSVK
jgi:hypothetical protein